ncbi:neutral zinc metallopeptidase [Nonomuraea aridisoli]|uniref:neutral zinc metallopeptidase n=1 Tax=Nonomuraea aridisoli TaxID=2070368 RepID=UPI001F461846|nr:neutral zinc metallopeptidase [Nonomuraea aridisoli]
MAFAPLSRVLALVVAVTLSCGQIAHAAPVADPFPEKAGKLGAVSCPETPIVQGGIPRPRQYLQAVMKCLDKSWKAYVARAGRDFTKPVAHYYDEPAETMCGLPWPGHVEAAYCPGNATIVFSLTGRWIDDRTDLYPMKVAAHEYAHHAQSLLGVRRAYDKAYKRAADDRKRELQRRYELQADCLSGVFLGSAWRSLTRTPEDWAELLVATRASGDEDGPRTHGTGASRVAWLQRGYRAQSPAACDTWSAPASKVS